MPQVTLISSHNMVADFRLQATGCGIRNTDYGLWIMDYRLRTTNYKLKPNIQTKTPQNHATNPHNCSLYTKLVPHNWRQTCNKFPQKSMTHNILNFEKDSMICNIIEEIA